LISAISKSGHLIRITDERIYHIISNHPEAKDAENRIIQTIEDPDIILEGDFGEILAIRLYSKSPVTQNKFLVAVFKETGDMNGFLLTAYYSRKINLRRNVLWKR
jgi:hypothetical protein